MNAKRGVPYEEMPQKTHYVGNNLKSMHISVKNSLKNLRTDYIDILYVHYWDYTCSVQEVMNGLHNLVADGKVLYLGISDTPAWIVSKANNYAQMAGKTPFVIYEGEWNIMLRDFERDILPMAMHEGALGLSSRVDRIKLLFQGLALAPWNVLASGKIRTDAEEKRRMESGEGGRTLFSGWLRNEEERRVCSALEKVAKEVEARSITSGTRSRFMSGLHLRSCNVYSGHCLAYA
jgi:aryl-alcohol dehydrogenase-like predicted oxidoreductase